MSRSKGRSRQKQSRQSGRKVSDGEREAHPAWVYGYHAIMQLLDATPPRIKQILIQSGRDDERANELYKLARQNNLSVNRVTRDELEGKFPDANHQGFVAEIEPAKVQNEGFLEALLVSNSNPFLLILDQVQDPHNLGAILRSAAASGIDAVIAPLRQACGLTGAARKVAVGAAEIVPYVQVTNLSRTMKFLQEQGVFIVGLAGEAQNNLFDSKETGPLAIAMGNEAKGLRRLTREHCDALIKIPMSGAIESLNVSVATGICVFHYAEQRN
jgi:23S rRNA (guanosine2251-2'-O)-methyltransferase